MYCNFKKGNKLHMCILEKENPAFKIKSLICVINSLLRQVAFRKSLTEVSYILTYNECFDRFFNQDEIKVCLFYDHDEFELFQKFFLLTKNSFFETTPFIQVDGLVDKEFTFLFNKNSLLFFCYLLEKHLFELPKNCQFLKHKTIK